MKKFILIALIGLFTPISVNATLIDGNGFFTDDITGLQWRKMSYTDGLSYNEALASTLAGGANEGYRVASGTEVLTLYDNYITADLSSAPSAISVGDYGDYQILFDRFEYTYVEVFNNGTLLRQTTQGYTSDYSNNFPNAMLSIGLMQWIRNDIQYGLTNFNFDQGSQPPDTTIPWDSMGTYLVYDASPVPEPATMMLFGIGLLGLAGVSRKK